MGDRRWDDLDDILLLVESPIALASSEYPQEMPSSLSVPVSDLDPADVKDDQHREPGHSSHC